MGSTHIILCAIFPGEVCHGEVTTCMDGQAVCGAARKNSKN